VRACVRACLPIRIAQESRESLGNATSPTARVLYGFYQPEE
jgi:hypothetical protein